MKYNKLGYFALLLIILSGCKIKHQISKESFGGTFGSDAPTHMKLSVPYEMQKHATAVLTDSLPIAKEEGLSIHIKGPVKSRFKDFNRVKKLLPVNADFSYNAPIKKYKSNSNDSSGAGMALIGLMLLLFLLLRKVIGLSAGWSWGIVIFILFIILLFIVGSD